MEKKEYIVSGLKPAISQQANVLLKMVGMCDGAFVKFSEKLIITYKEKATDTEKTIQSIKDSYEKVGGQSIIVSPVSPS